MTFYFRDQADTTCAITVSSMMGVVAINGFQRLDVIFLKSDEFVSSGIQFSDKSAGTN